MFSVYIYVCIKLNKSKILKEQNKNIKAIGGIIVSNGLVTVLFRHHCPPIVFLSFSKVVSKR